MNLVPSVPYKSSMCNNNYHDCFMEGAGGGGRGGWGGEGKERRRERERKRIEDSTMNTIQYSDISISITNGEVKFFSVFRIRRLLRLPHPDPLCRSTDPDPSIIKQK